MASSTSQAPLTTAVGPGTGTTRACNICGEGNFKPAPFNRLSRGGLPPVCIKCGSLERHRVFRSIFLGFRDARFKEWSCLSFSKDSTVATGWFRNYEFSLFGVSNSLDVQAINRPDASYDMVICNHVLEHVPHYRLAIGELVRIVKPHGLIFLSFPNPMWRQVTEDWGFPKVEQHGHYRIFGRDVETVFAQVVPHVHVLSVEGTDDVTGDRDMAYVLTQSGDIVAHMQRCVDARVVKSRVA